MLSSNNLLLTSTCDVFSNLLILLVKALFISCLVINPYASLRYSLILAEDFKVFFFISNSSNSPDTKFKLFSSDNDFFLKSNSSKNLFFSITKLDNFFSSVFIIDHILFS